MKLAAAKNPDLQRKEKERNQGFCIQMSQGGYPPQIEFFGKICLGFENLITLSVILRHLEAELLSILRCFKTQGGYMYFHFFNFCFFNFFNPPQIHFWWKPLKLINF
jgi:hypothetical protein